MKCWKRNRRNRDPYLYCPRTKSRTRFFNQFSLDILKKCSAEGNIVLSPLSIALALSMIEAGSDGETKRQIGELMMKGMKDERIDSHYKDIFDTIMTRPADENIELLIANLLFIREGLQIEDAYLKRIGEAFDAKAENIDTSDAVKATEKINAFIDEATHGGIREIVDEDDLKQLVALLVNGTYFHAKWLNRFFPANYTEEQKFFSSPDNYRMVDMMQLGKGLHLYSSDDVFHSVSLKYTDPTFLFTIYLPKERFGLDSALRTYTGLDMTNLTKKRKFFLIEFFMPRLNISTDIHLSIVLKDLGVTTIFEKGAHLEDIAKGLSISEVTHKAVIEVNEEGTTAFASTTAQMSGCGLGDPPPIIILDHPFLFTVTRDDHIIFMGKFI